MTPDDFFRDIETDEEGDRVLEPTPLLSPEPNRVYRGRRENGLAVVTVDGLPLDPRPSLALRDHSPTGFEWGYGGSGPAQLALALLFDATGNREASLELYQLFKAEVVARFPVAWQVDAETVRAWVGAHWIPPDLIPDSPETPE